MSTETTPSSKGEANVDAPLPESLRRLVCLSLSHDAVSTDRIGEVAPDEPAALARAVKSTDRVTECVILVTCNRVELYASTRTADEDDIETALELGYDVLDEPRDVQEYVGLDAVEHLLRVSAGLESAALGEDQILGQVNETFDAAAEAELVGGVLSRVADVAIRAGRQCREETSINDGETGYGGVICRQLVDELGEPPERLVLIGAGEMATVAARAVESRWETRIDVVNRSETHTLTTAGGEYWPLDQLEVPLQDADAVVTATGAETPVLTAGHVENCAPGTPILDLANPADVAEQVRLCSDVSVTDLEELTAQLRMATQSKQAVVPAVEGLIDDAIDRLVASERENRAEDTLRALHRKAAGVREAELERAATRLEHGEEPVETVLEEFASALTGQLLADPTEALRAAARDGDAETIAAANQLFDLDGGEDQ